MEVIGVGQLDLTVDIFQVSGVQRALDGALGTTFMNTGVSAVPWAQEKCPRRALPWVVMTSNIINSLSQEMNMASPKLKNR